MSLGGGIKLRIRRGFDAEQTKNVKSRNSPLGLSGVLPRAPVVKDSHPKVSQHPPPPPPMNFFLRFPQQDRQKIAEEERSRWHFLKTSYHRNKRRPADEVTQGRYAEVSQSFLRVDFGNY